MEIRDFARTVVETEDLAVKLAPAPGNLTDDYPGPALRSAGPGRPPSLRISPSGKAAAPAVRGFHDPAQRRRILHALANHELQAAELFAWALLAFPEAPPEFRRGLLKILDDEQRHTRMYVARLEETGARFGDYPVSGYFWSKAPAVKSPLAFVCAMSLTFENANLDHTTESAEAARRAGDEKTAAVIDRVHADEIEHVRFGWTWLQLWKARDEPAWKVYCANLAWPLLPKRARGRMFNRQARKAAGLDEETIHRLEDGGR